MNDAVRTPSVFRNWASVSAHTAIATAARTLTIRTAARLPGVWKRKELITRAWFLLSDDSPHPRGPITKDHRRFATSAKAVV